MKANSRRRLKKHMTRKYEFAKFVALARRSRWAALSLALWFLSLGLSANAQEGTFVTFDAPGAGMGPFEGTLPFAIDPAGVITGAYFDANFVPHGFLRFANGTVTPFDVPGAVSTYPSGGISLSGAITGTYGGPNGSGGFVRAPNGSFTTFDFGFPDLFVASPLSISPAGTIAGTYIDATDFALHGFLRNPDGTTTTFEAPGAGTSFLQGTQPVSISPGGTVAGCYVDAHSVGHGFVRAKDGTLTMFDVPNSTNLLLLHV